MAVTMEQIKQLREQTGAGMMDVRNALQEAEGDMARALEILRQKGAATAEKKSARATGEGKVAARVEDNGRIGALVEVNCETDFSANNDRFLALVDAVVQAAAMQDHATVDDLLKTAHPEASDLKTLLTDTIGAVKENMAVTRVVRYTAQAPGNRVHAYIHGNGKMGVLLELAALKPETREQDGFVRALKDVAMHIAAFGPEYVGREDVPQQAIDSETRIEMGKEDIQAKPEAIRGKIVSGRVEKNLAQRVLLLQPFVKDPNKTVEAMLQEAAAELNDSLRVVRFTRFVLGEVQAAAAPLDAETPQACGV